MARLKVWDAAASVWRYVSGLDLSAGRNLLDNSEMKVSQRQATNAGIVPVSGMNTFDRWKVEYPVAAGAIYPSYATVNGEFGNMMILQSGPTYSPAAGSYGRITQAIEGVNVQHLRWGTASAQSLVLSLTMYSDAARTIIIEIENIGATNRGVSRAINLSAGLGTYQVTVPGDTGQVLINDTGARLMVGIWFAAGSTYSGGSSLNSTWGVATTNTRAYSVSNFFVAGTGQINFISAQLEIGVVATAFEHRPYADELRRCQRYLYASPTGNLYASQGFGVLASTTVSSFTIPFPVRMRSSPTITYVGSFRVYDPLGAVAGTVSAVADGGSGSMTPDIGAIAVTAGALTAGRPVALQANNDVTAQLRFSAEI